MKKHSEVFGKDDSLEEKYTHNQLLAMKHNEWLIEKSYIDENKYFGNIENIMQGYLCAYNHIGEEAIISCRKDKPESCMTFDLNASENGAWVANNLRNKK